MNAKDVLELQNLFTVAAQKAKIRDKIKYKLDMNAETLAEYIKEAFPKMQDSQKVLSFAKTILDIE